MSIITDDDWLFIDRLNERFRYLRRNFEDALAVNPEARLAWAEVKLSRVQRSGYVARGIPSDDAETVAEHTKHCMDIVASYPVDEQASLEIRNMLRVHDIAEAITLDFCRDDPISPDEKERLEDIAARVIFENDKFDMKRFFQLFVANETINAHRAHDVDRVQVLFRTLEYYDLYPHFADTLDEFWRAFSEIKNLTEFGSFLHGAASTHKKQQDKGRQHDADGNAPSM